MLLTSLESIKIQFLIHFSLSTKISLQNNITLTKNTFKPIIDFKHQLINKFFIFNNPLEFTEIAFDLSCKRDCFRGIKGGEAKKVKLQTSVVNKISCAYKRIL